MKFSPLDVPNRINEAKMYLNHPSGEAHDRNGYVFFNIDKIEAYYETARQLQEQLAENLRELFADTTGEYKMFNPSSPADIKTILINYMNIPESDLMHQGKVSSGKEVIYKLREKYNTPFIHAYIQYNEQATRAGNLKYYFENIKPMPGKYNNEGARIGMDRMVYRLVETYRMNSYEPNIQGLARDLCDIITAPAGWVVVQVDSKQIEPKIYYSTIIKDPMIFWLIEQYDDVYFALADYCLREDVEYRPDNLFKIEELNPNIRTTLKTLVNAGNYGSTLDKLKKLSTQIYKKGVMQTEEGKTKYSMINQIGGLERKLRSDKIPEKYKAQLHIDLSKALAQFDDIQQKGSELAERFFKRLVKHPHRVEYEKKIDNMIRTNNARLIKSPFGDERVVYGSATHIKNCFINNPIQMSVARLSAISICQAFELCEKYPQGVQYAFHKHDEDVFYVKAKIAEQLAEEFIKPFREYEIEGWSPIQAECKIGLDYTKD